MRRHLQQHFSVSLAILFLFTTTFFGCQKDVWKSDICLSLDEPQAVCPVCKPASSDANQWIRDLKDLLVTAASLHTNQQTLAPSPDATHGASTRHNHGSVSPASCVDITSADASTLEKLPGIGPGRAQAILEARSQKPFRKKSDIRRIKGIGKKSFQKLAPHICDIPGQS